jgi:hypothetical protein
VYAPSSVSGPAAYCINYVSCYGDGACAPPYACVRLLDQFATESAYTTDWDNGAPGLCARAAP